MKEPARNQHVVKLFVKLSHVRDQVRGKLKYGGVTKEIMEP